jgi:hypothetical protein
MNDYRQIFQTNILWTGIEYYSLENCHIRRSGAGYEIDAVINGFYEDRIYRVDYKIRTNLQWETASAHIKCRHRDEVQEILLEADGKGGWTRNGRDAPELGNCMDIDIPLTPFTNTLPIKRLSLATGETREIQVVYVDLLNRRITPVRQKYTRLSETTYRYENVPNDFEAVIGVDAAGLVIAYPELFTRTAREDGNIPLGIEPSTAI